MSRAQALPRRELAAPQQVRRSLVHLPQCAEYTHHPGISPAHPQRQPMLMQQAEHGHAHAWLVRYCKATRLLTRPRPRQPRLPSAAARPPLTAALPSSPSTPSTSAKTSPVSCARRPTSTRSLRPRSPRASRRSVSSSAASRKAAPWPCSRASPAPPSSAASLA